MAKKTRIKNKKQTTLTLEKFIEYNKEFFIPELKEIFVGKKEFNDLKNETQKNFDKALKKLDTLLAEKAVREYQEEKEKRLWAIVLKALKDHSILTIKELELIAKLEVF